jgi:predicted phosphodiesterase
MVLSIQWLAILGDIVSYYNEMCMSFNWKGQEVMIRGDSLIKLQTIIFE